MYISNKYPRCCNSDALHELTPKSASWWLTQKPYENHFLSKKNAVSHTIFAGRLTLLASQIVCTSFMLEL